MGNIGIKFDRAAQCLSILKFCGTRDGVAVKFHTMLSPYFESLRNATGKTPSVDTHLTQLASTSELHLIESELFDLVRRPFDAISKHGTGVSAAHTFSGKGKQRADA